jgi:hypothetical protein
MPFVGRKGAPIMNTALRDIEKPEARLTVGVEGSFGVLLYPVLALSAGLPTTDRRRTAGCWLTEDLLVRGFRPVRDADVEDIVLKAQLADGSIRCRISADGLVSLLVDNNLVWSRQVDPEDRETARWILAVRTRELTIVSGDLVSDGQSDGAGSWKPEVMAKVPTAWIP